MGCDTLVALGTVTSDGVALLAKNSDRPPRECQRIVRIPRRSNPVGARLRCQYIEVPEVAETATVLGSQPYWLWGLEHGVNQHRVAIGNETVFAKELLGPVGLTGMDLVRLGLERARTATEALEVMVDLIETHGQGGSGHVHLDWPYHNGFLIADPTSAWILETSDRHWAARRVPDVGNVSNGLALGTDWERGAVDLTSFAVGRGWWTPEQGKVDFAAAYADDGTVPPNLCVERRRRGATLLDGLRGRASASALRGVLRDHYDAGPASRPDDFTDPHFFALCMHADPLDNTTAGMVARLPIDPTEPAAAWMCLGSPCVGAFLPCYVDAEVPAVLGVGGAEVDRRGPWWRTRELLTLVERDPRRWGPHVRACWDPFEEALAWEAVDVEAAARVARQAGDAAKAAAGLGAFTARATTAWMERLEGLIAELARA